MVKILLIGDTHCGDKAGLTPPGLCVTEAQKALWLWWESFNAVHNSTPFDMVIFTGDMVEGQNNKNTIELYETDTEKQAEIAAECMGSIKCHKSAMFTVYGTPFHTSGTYSFENHFTDTLGIARPLTVHRIDVGGMVRLNVKHTVGRSSIPYGQGTPTYKEMVNEILNAELSDDDAADIVIRGHAHYSVGMRVRDRAAIVVPCLKYPGSVFGRKLPEGQYDMGVGILEVYGKKDWRYIPVHIPVHVSSKREWIRWNQEQ
jgi:hypothetical protein